MRCTSGLIGLYMRDTSVLQLDFHLTFSLRGSGWCSGDSSRLAPMHPGFKSRSGCMCKWLSQSMLALAGFLRFPPAFKIGTCLAQSITPPHPGGMGSCRVKKWILQSSADRQSRFHGSTPK